MPCNTHEKLLQYFRIICKQVSQFFEQSQAKIEKILHKFNKKVETVFHQNLLTEIKKNLFFVELSFKKL